MLRDGEDAAEWSCLDSLGHILLRPPIYDLIEHQSNGVLGTAISYSTWRARRVPL